MTKDFQDPARAYAATPQANAADVTRFTPADNLYDAIRADVAKIGGIEFQPLFRHLMRELPFNNIDFNPHDE